MFITLTACLHTLFATCCRWRTLDDIELYDGYRRRPQMWNGATAAVFKVLHHGKLYKLRCLLRTKYNSRAIYGDRYYPEELFVTAPGQRSAWADVILEEWVEGESLELVIRGAIGDREQMAALADKFDRFALDLLSQPWAHGDLKPDNMVVTPEGELRLVDFDAMYLPQFTYADCEELGTRGYQHPRRADIFDKHIDDYPIALISTMLHAFALDPTLSQPYSLDDKMFITPAEAIEGRDPALDEVERLLALQGNAARYRIAQLLRSPYPTLTQLKELLSLSLRTPQADSGEPLESDTYRGWWGFRNPQGEFVIPPLYDCVWEFTEGLAAVQLGRSWHFIDRLGNVVISCGECDGVKPFRDGVAYKVVGGKREKLILG